MRTTAQIPATLAFLDIAPEERRQMGIDEGMVRISSGIESCDDLIADVAQALDRIA